MNARRRYIADIFFVGNLEFCCDFYVFSRTKVLLFIYLNKSTMECRYYCVDYSKQCCGVQLYFITSIACIKRIINNCAFVCEVV